MGAVVVVVPDRGSKGEDTLCDTCADPRDSSAAVLFETELSFESVVDRLDDLTQGFEESLPGPGLFTLAGRPQHGDAGIGQFGFEIVAAVALVDDDRGPVGSDMFSQSRCGGEDVTEGFVFTKNRRRPLEITDPRIQA